MLGAALAILLSQQPAAPHVYDEIRRLRSQHSPDYKALGLAYYVARQHLLFRQTMERAAAENPADFEPHYYLGRHFDSDVSDAARAAEHFRKALERNPKHARSHAGLAHTLEVRGENEAAAAGYRQALTIEPCNGAAHLGLARLGLDAHDHALRAVRCDPSNAAARRLAAKYTAGTEAVRHLEEAAQIEPSDAATMYLLHRAYRAVGNETGAAKALAAYRRLQEIYGAN